MSQMKTNGGNKLKSKIFWKTNKKHGYDDESKNSKNGLKKMNDMEIGKYCICLFQNEYYYAQI